MDWATAASASHKMKANLGFFGMLNSQALIQQIEIELQRRLAKPGIEGCFKQKVGDQVARINKQEKSTCIKAYSK
jgi:HPt (histidine-containing phosphotransfer) domain-containing protein